MSCRTKLSSSAVCPVTRPRPGCPHPCRKCSEIQIRPSGEAQGAGGHEERQRCHLIRQKDVLTSGNITNLHVPIRSFSSCSRAAHVPCQLVFHECSMFLSMASFSAHFARHIQGKRKNGSSLVFPRSFPGVSTCSRMVWQTWHRLINVGFTYIKSIGLGSTVHSLLWGGGEKKGRKNACTQRVLVQEAGRQDISLNPSRAVESLRCAASRQTGVRRRRRRLGIS